MLHASFLVGSKTKMIILIPMCCISYNYRSMSMYLGVIREES